MQKILLCGYMGSGKTTVAQILAQKTKLQGVDLDAVIEKNGGLSISDIFNEKGEIFFRKLESETLLSILESDEAIVLALGGGTPAYGNNHLQLKNEGVVSFYLKGSIETLYQRLVGENATRPLVAGKTAEEIKELIAKQLFERNYYYHQATHTIAIDQKSPETIADEIMQLLA